MAGIFDEVNHIDDRVSLTEIYRPGALRSLTARAGHAAKARLISRHADEYEEILKAERTRRGLPPQAHAKHYDALRQRVAELEAQLAERNVA